MRVTCSHAPNGITAWHERPVAIHNAANGDAMLALPLGGASIVQRARERQGRKRSG